jgi:Domain of unknown function (DUF929)
MNRDSQRTPTGARSGARARGADRREQVAARRRTIVAMAAAAIVLVLVALVVARPLLRRLPAPTDTGPVSPAVLQELTSIPAAEANVIGQGTALNLPELVHGPLLRGANGHPRVLYVGAEYCPFCAAERWAMVVALSRFGSFSGLRTARSAADDVFPSTPTFTLYGATYQSDHIDFSPVELTTSVRGANGYQPLQTPTADELQVIQQYNAPPYVSAQSAGAIPFLDVANQYVLQGATFSPAILANRSWDQIAASLSDPNSDQAKAIVGSANVLTAAICGATGNAPPNVCGQPAITSLEAALAKQPGPTPTP